MKSEISEKSSPEENFPILKKIVGTDLIKQTIPYSDIQLKSINEIFHFRSNLIQNIICFHHNHFEIGVITEPIKLAKTEELNLLTEKEIEKVFIQVIAGLKMAISRGLNFINFSRFQIAPNLSVKFPICLDKNEKVPIAEVLSLFKQHGAFSNLAENNYEEAFSGLIRRHPLDMNYFYAYRFNDFASNILNRYPLTQLRHDANIKIKIITENEIQKKLVKINLHQNLFSEDILFVDIEDKTKSIRESLAEIVLGQMDYMDDPDDYAALTERIKIYCKTTYFQSIIIIANSLERREDTEFINYLLNSLDFSKIVFILLGDNDGIEFDLEFKDKPKNLLSEHLPVKSRAKKLESAKYLNDKGLFEFKIMRTVEAQKLGELKSVLKNESRRPEIESQFRNGLKLIMDHREILFQDGELLELYTDILIKNGYFQWAKELIQSQRGKNKTFLDLKKAYLLKIEKEYSQMNRILREVENSLPDNLKDEFHYLKFVFFDKTGNQAMAGRHFKKIGSTLFVYRSNLILSDRLIYRGEHHAAKVLLNKAIQFFKQRGHYREEIEARSQIAKIFRAKGNFVMARRLYQNLYIKSEIRNFHLMAADICVDLGNLYFFQDDFAPSEHWYRRAHKIFHNQKNQNGELLARSNMAEIDKIKGDWPAVEKFFKTILKYDQEKKSIGSIAVDVFNIAHLEFLRHNFPRAKALVEKAINLFQQKENLNGLIESQLLKLKILAFLSSKDADFGFLKEHEGILSRDQKCILRLLKSVERGISEDQFDSIMAGLDNFNSKVLQFEMLILLIERSGVMSGLNRLKELLNELSAKGRNYFFYEYYYFYFQQIKNPQELDEEKNEIFQEMYYFFLRNKRKIKHGIHELKKHIDERDSMFDIFKAAELVVTSIQWKVPDDFFKSFMNELTKNIQVDLIKLNIYEKGQPVFKFSNIHEFDDLTEEIMTKAVSSAEHFNLDLEDIKTSFRSQERAFYPYINTKILLWKISDHLFGLLLLGFRHDHYFYTDIMESQKRVLKKFASLFDRFYQTDYKFNKKLEFIVGRSPAIILLKQQIRKVSKVYFSLLITGESGSGKELVAKGVHLLSQRSTGSFVAVNSAAIPENLLEAELFGYKKGAFTGANENRMGLIEEASGGTLFMDEIADLHINLQAKLLRVLQEKELRRLGENNTRKVDIRLISATNRNLTELIQRKEFREDLYFRIGDLQIRVPPLRERKEDIPLLARFFLEKNNFPLKNEMELQRIGTYFQNQKWPGNVRELESKVKRLITFYPDFDMDGYTTKPENSSLKAQREHFECSLIMRTLNENNWNKVKTAEKLKISRMALFNLIKKHNIQQHE